MSIFKQGIQDEAAKMVGTALIAADFSGDARGETAIDIQTGRSGTSEIASGEAAITIGRKNTASGDYSTAIGYDCTADDNRSTAIGYTAFARVRNTINMGGAIINRKDNGETAIAAFYSFVGAQIVFMTKERDLKEVADHTIYFPSDCKFWITECGLVATNIDTLSVQPTVRYGITGSPAKHGAAAITTNITAEGKMEIETPLVPGDGETSLVAGVTIAATATTARGRFYFVGKLIENADFF